MNHTDNKRGILFNRKTQTGKGTSAANQASAASKRAKQLTKQKRSSSNKASSQPLTPDPQPATLPPPTGEHAVVFRVVAAAPCTASRRYGGSGRRNSKLEPNGALAVALKHVAIKLHAPKNRNNGEGTPNRNCWLRGVVALLIRGQVFITLSRPRREKAQNHNPAAFVGSIDFALPRRNALDVARHQALAKPGRVEKSRKPIFRDQHSVELRTSGKDLRP